MPNMTLDALAALTQQEFQTVHGRIDTLEKRVGSLEAAVEQLSSEMHQRFGELHALSTEMRDMIRGFSYAREIDDLRGRVTRVEKKVGL
jgi:polyhydroxyalkanoate synthesis regulator phasin